MPNQDPKVTAQLRRLLEPVPALKNRCDELMHCDPAPGSTGTIDRAGVLMFRSPRSTDPT